MIGFLHCRVFSTLVLLQSAVALQCGQPLTTQCLGATDVRYNPGASNDAVDQAQVWTKFGGYFIGEGKVQILFPGSTQLSSAYDLQLFINNTILGSRLYSHRIELNSLNDIFFTDTFATTTYEKDGKLSFVTTGAGGQNFFDAYPVDSNSAFLTYKNANGDVGSESWYALDPKALECRILSDQFESVNGSLILSKTYSAFNTRVSEEEWVAAVNNAYNQSAIPQDIQEPVPMLGNCFNETCPAEQDWCSQDPECSTSPYQEPSASMTPGALAGFIIAGIVVLLALFYFIHRFLQIRQAKRYKTVFAKRIAETVQVNKSMRSMAPQELAEEFKRVDLQTEDGLITKDDLWEFISSGKAGEISQGDFNALFAAIDADGDGQVDFLAFCAFMGQCHDEYKLARADQAHLTDISARREQVADSAAHASFRRISSSASMDGSMAQNMKEAALGFRDDDDDDDAEKKHDIELQNAEVPK